MKNKKTGQAWTANDGTNSSKYTWLESGDYLLYAGRNSGN